MTAPLLRRPAFFAVATALLLAGALAFAATVQGDEPPPVADAGADQRLECTSPRGAAVHLDGSATRVGSNASEVSYVWREGANATSGPELARGVEADVTLPLGRHELTLSVYLHRFVEDANGTVTRDNVTGNMTNETLMDSVVVEVVDTTAPTLVATPSLATLWPPNHKLRAVDVAVQVSDACSTPTWLLASATSDEPADGKGDGNTPTDLLDVAVGTQDTGFLLRSERAGPGDGRVYALTYEARDASGNAARTDALVTVPHAMDG